MRVVPAFDVAEDGQARFGVGRKAVLREALDFERREEALGHGVVIGIPARSHRRPDPEQLAALSERKRTILRALIRVMHDVGGAALRCGLTVFRYIEGWYNPHRRHSALGQRSPLAFEQVHAVQSRAA